MLKEILSISGKPGLYKLVSYGKNHVIVESLADKKRFPTHTREKIISLGDIAIYTTGDDVPLSKVLTSIYGKYAGKQLQTSDYKTPEQLHAFFKEVLPDYDEDRVYKTDIKKVISWYNALVNAGFTSFEEEEKGQDTPASDNDKDSE